MDRHEAESELVAYLGPPASYTHQAAIQACQYNSLIPHKTIQDVCHAVSSGAVHRGIVPLENSSNGIVNATVAELVDECCDVFVVREAYVKVEHCLLGARLAEQSFARASNGMHTRTEGEGLDFLTDVYSHEQALGQCSRYLDSLGSEVKKHETSSTSAAACLVAEEKTPKKAAVASRLAADVYGLDILRRGIQNSSQNGTRFVLLEKGKATLSLESTGRSSVWKSLLRFQVAHQSGSLVEALLVFKGHGINLTSLNSRPSHNLPWSYVFLVEFEYEGTSNQAEEAIAGVLKQFHSMSARFTYFGTWIKVDTDTLSVH